MCFALIGEYATPVGRWSLWRSRRGEEANEKRSVKMISVAEYTGSSIKQALELAGGGKPDLRVCLIFPIDAEAFFVPAGPGATST